MVKKVREASSCETDNKNVSGVLLMDVLTAIPYSLQHFHPLDPHRYIILDCETVCKI